MTRDIEHRIRNVTAVLGPTNTGKTHLAIERMLGYQSGLIGLPLRLLAREVYDKIAARAGAQAVALITGEERIKPERARYFVCTVEAMPHEADVEFLAIDEVQLAADPERGHVFTDRLLHVRGRHETLLLGAQTMRETIADLIPGANFISRPRLSKLTYAGEKKITRLPSRTAIVAF
jgi:ATP-dependent RNA helicase SUPV3L1/SUV3